MRRLEAIGRLRSLEDEFRAAEFALAEALARAEVDPAPAVLQGLSPSDLHRARAGLEATYTIRLFAEFEGAVRSYWQTMRRTEPPMRKLLDGVAARRKIPADLHAEAHEVREHRNELVHGPLKAGAWQFVDCRSVLCRLLAWLPDDW